MNHNFKELKIWQKSIALTKDIYTITKNFPKEEMFGLTNQIRRCAVSVPSNIAEGCGRDTPKQLINFLNIAMGSLCELETQLLISKELHYIKQQNSKEILNNIDEIGKMINGLRKNLIMKLNQSKV